MVQASENTRKQRRRRQQQQIFPKEKNVNRTIENVIYDLLTLIEIDVALDVVYVAINLSYSSISDFVTSIECDNLAIFYPQEKTRQIREVHGPPWQNSRFTHFLLSVVISKDHKKRRK